MKFVFGHFFLLCALVFASTLSVAETEKREITDLAPSGVVKNAQSPLSEASYLPLEAQKLAKAKVVWVNFELLREMGINVPPEGMTPEFEQKVLDAFGYAVPQKRDKADLFTGETKTFLADGYGGMGMNGNLGSGRAASAGEVQIKGIGVTPMVGPNVTAPWKRHGGAGLHEAIREAVWGEVLNSELPHGANRIVAVLAPGTKTHWGPVGDPRALIVRVDPLRPAHFLMNPSAEGAHKVWDEKRVDGVMKTLLASLPTPAGEEVKGDRAERLKQGIFEFAARIARQEATSYAKQFYHGAPSPSNAQLDGGALDFGTVTSNKNFSRMYILPDVNVDGAFGSTKLIYQDLMEEILASLKRTLPEDLKDALPTQMDVRDHIDTTFRDTVRKELVKLTGAPDHLVDKLAGSSDLRLLGETLLEMTKRGNEKARWAPVFTPRNSGRYNIGAILSALAAAKSTEADVLSKAIEKLVPNSPVNWRDKLVEQYLNFRNEIVQEAAKDGVSEEGILGFMERGSVVRNGVRNELLRDRFLRANVGMIFKHILTGRVDHMAKKIDSYVEKSIYNHSTGDPYELVVEQRQNQEKGIRAQTIFNAKTGETHSRIRITDPSPERLAALGIKGDKLGFAEGSVVTGKPSGRFLDFDFKGPVPTSFRDRFSLGELASTPSEATREIAAVTGTGSECPFGSIQ